jgi:hypothetical protein
MSAAQTHAWRQEPYQDCNRHRRGCDEAFLYPIPIVRPIFVDSLAVSAVRLLPFFLKYCNYGAFSGSDWYNVTSPRILG